ncbi:MAG TPA: MBL fold metallo-hydrolase [Dehalococcoidia bacterium]|nr:MBL fold metallo-hydrolase [Dehalococcoidia bacterium]
MSEATDRSAGLRVIFLGTGDPFASGGRLQSAILIDAGAGGRFLLDCGATTLVALARAGIDPDSIDGVLLSHFHGDHAGGLPLLLLDLVANREGDGARPPRARPLTIAGPEGTEEFLREALALFRWSGALEAAHAAGALRFVTLVTGSGSTIDALRVLPFAAVHTPEALMFRLTLAGRTLAYSGDTAWTEAILPLCMDADLFICQTYTFALPQRTMLSHAELMARRSRLSCRRLVLVHIGAEMQRHLAEAGARVAEDGMTIDL